jgi:hypothetical protein
LNNIPCASKTRFEIELLKVITGSVLEPWLEYHTFDFRALFGYKYWTGPVFGR